MPVRGSSQKKRLSSFPPNFAIELLIKFAAAPPVTELETECALCFHIVVYACTECITLLGIAMSMFYYSFASTEHGRCDM